MSIVKKEYGMNIVKEEFGITSSRKFSAVFVTGFICLLGLHSLAASASSCNDDARELSGARRLAGYLGYFQEVVSGESLPSISNNLKCELPSEVLVNILCFLDPKSLAQCRIVCRDFNIIALNIEAVYTKYACIGCQFAQDWMLMACEKWKLEWLHRKSLD